MNDKHHDREKEHQNFHWDVTQRLSRVEPCTSTKAKKSDEPTETGILVT